MEKVEEIKAMIEKFRLLISNEEKNTSGECDVIDDKILHIRGWSNAGNGNLDTAEIRKEDGRLDRYRVNINALERAKNAIKQKYKEAAKLSLRFIEFLELKLDSIAKGINIEDDERYKTFTAEEKKMFEEFISGKGNRFKNDDTLMFINAVMGIQIYADDGYWNGGQYLEILLKAKETARKPAIISNNGIIENMRKFETATGASLKKSEPFFIDDTQKKITDLTDFVNYYKREIVKAEKKKIYFDDFKVDNTTPISKISEIINDIKASDSIPNKDEIIVALNNILKAKKSIFQKGKVDTYIKEYNELLASSKSKAKAAEEAEFHKILEKVKKIFPTIAPRINNYNTMIAYLNEIARLLSVLENQIKADPNYRKPEENVVDPIRVKYLKSSPLNKNKNYTFYRQPVSSNSQVVSYKKTKENFDETIDDIVLSRVKKYDFKHVDPDRIPTSVEGYLGLLDIFLENQWVNVMIINNKQVRRIIDQIVELEMQKGTKKEPASYAL